MTHEELTLVKANLSQNARVLALRFGVYKMLLIYFGQISRVKKLDKLVSRDLSENRKQRGACLSLLLRYKSNLFLHRIVIYDKGLIFCGSLY